MSDYTNKSKPLLERIAEMCGKSVPFGPIGGSGGIPVLTVHDVAAAVAMARQYKERGTRSQGREAKRDPPPLATCVRPELLLLVWGGRTDFVPVIARVCADAIDKGDPRMTRAAAMLSAQAIAGRKPDMVTSTWALACSLSELESAMGGALAWMNGELHEAERAYTIALRRWADVATDEAAHMREMHKAINRRADILRGKRAS